MTGIHEYTQELIKSNTSGVPGKMKQIFGKSYVTLPNLWMPGWIYEGIAAYNEAQLTKYQGCLNTGLGDAAIGSGVTDGRLPSLLDATFLPAEYSQDSLANWGGAFFQYLATTYGEAKVNRFFEVNGGQIGAFLFTPKLGLDRSATQVFGKTLPQLWQDWQQYEAKRGKRYHYDGKLLTNYERKITNLQTYRSKLYFQCTNPVKTGAFMVYSFSEIMERDLVTGLTRTVVSTTGEFTSNLRVRHGRIYYVIKEPQPILYQYDLTTQKKRQLLRANIRSFEVLDDGAILYSKSLNKGFGSALYRFDPPTGQRTIIV